MIKELYRFLKQNKIAVYFPSQHKGNCETPYVVIKNGGSQQFLEFSTTTNLYDIMCYVPFDKYSILEDYVLSVRNKIKELSEIYKIVIQDEETTAFYDESNKSYMISFICELYKKKEGN